MNKPKAKIRCYDNGGCTMDRYTVVYMDQPENRPGSFAAVGMNDSPFHPQGFGQHCTATPGSHLGRRIKFSELPPDCQKLVNQDLQGEKPLKKTGIEYASKDGTWERLEL